MDKPNKNDENCQERPMNTNFEEIFYESPIGIAFYDKKGRLINANDSALNIARIPKLDDILDNNIFDIPSIASKMEELHEKGLIKFQDSLDLTQIKEQNIYNPIESKIIYIDYTVSVTDSGYLIQIQDITESKKDEGALKESKERYHEFFTNPIVGLGLCKVVVDEKGEAIDYIYLEVNDTFEEFTGLKRGEIINKGVKEVLPEDADNLINIFGPVGLTRKRIKVKVPIPTLGRIYDVSSYSPSDKHFIAIFTDITERIKAEEEINQSIDRFNMAQKVSNVGTFEWNIKAGINTWTPELEAMYGLQEGEFPGTQEAWEELLHPEDKQKTINGVDIALETGKPVEAEFRVIWPDGSVHWVLGRWQVIKDDDGSLLKLIGVNVEITERKKAEEALSQSQKLLQDIIDGFTSPIFVKDTEGRFLTVNKNLEELLGVKNEELKGKTDYDIITKELADYYRDNDQKVLEEGKALAIEEEADLIDGHHTFIANKFPIYDNNGKPYGIGSISTDISERKKIEENLKESEERLRLAQTLGNVGIWDWNTITNELHFTPELEQLYGLTPGTIKTYQDWRQLTHPDDIEKIEAERDEKIANHEPFDLEFRIQHKSGQKHWLSAKGGAIYNKEGDILRVLGINEDITLRKKADKKIQDLIEQLQQANEEYRESEDRFHTLADNIPNLAWMADAEGWIFWYNKQWYKYTGTTLEEMQGWGWQKVHHPDYVDSVTEEWNTKLTNEEPYDNIFPLKGEDGNYRWFLTRITPIRDAQGNLIRWFGTNTDVTERINRENELEITMDELKRSNEELERFAYVSSHDLQEPLRMVTLYSQLLERRYKDSLDDDANEFIGFAVDGAKRLDAMTNDLLQYSKITSEKREVKPVNFEHVLEHALTNLKVPIEENNAIITHDPLPTIIGDEQLKIQLFQNIIGNSIKYRSQETPKIHISAIKEKDHYLFSIIDNGIGMSLKHLEKIFTIFQRLHTHEEHEGTGIGLAIAQKIVHQQGGEIWAESEPGKGSTFYFTIPINE